MRQKDIAPSKTDDACSCHFLRPTMFARHVENILINTIDRLRERASSKSIT